jgi:hypothetical protein
MFRVVIIAAAVTAAVVTTAIAAIVVTVTRAARTTVTRATAVTAIVVTFTAAVSWAADRLRRLHLCQQRRCVFIYAVFVQRKVVDHRGKRGGLNVLWIWGRKSSSDKGVRFLSVCALTSNATKLHSHGK